jgi:hypothetical protein
LTLKPDERGVGETTIRGDKEKERKFPIPLVSLSPHLLVPSPSGLKIRTGGMKRFGKNAMKKS